MLTGFLGPREGILQKDWLDWSFPWFLSNISVARLVFHAPRGFAEHTLGTNGYSKTFVELIFCRGMGMTSFL